MPAKSRRSSRRVAPKRASRADAVTLLEKDHATLRKLLGELDASTSRGPRRREQLLGRVAMEIEVHAAIEEELFYPAFRRHGETDNDEKLFFEAGEEHDLVHGLLPELKATDPESEHFSARARVLKDLVEHHAEEEENELLPRARTLMSLEELETLGAQLERRKRELMGEPSGSGNGRRSGRSGEPSRAARR